jgi:hypothetical protein
MHLLLLLLLLLLPGNDAERRRYSASLEKADETEQSRWVCLRQ